MKSKTGFGHFAFFLFFQSGSVWFPGIEGRELPLQVERNYRLISGVQFDYVPASASHFYTEFVPLVFQYTIPRWNKSDTNIYGSQNCSATTYSKFFTTCPVLFYLSDVHDRFSEYLVNNQPLVANLEEMGAIPEITSIDFDCELIKPHFDDIYVGKVTLEKYLSDLKSCSPLGSQEFIQGITNYVYNISDIYFEMRKNFYAEYWLKIDLIDGRVDAAIWANAINIFNSLVYENYLMEANRWKLAVVDCEAGRIPSTVLPPSLLTDTLSDMLQSLPYQGLVPSISTNNVGNYYKSSLTDCTFTNDTFLVRVLVPVIPVKEKFKLTKLSPVPFYYEEDGSQFQCQIADEALPLQDSYALIDLTRNLTYESDCVPGQFCHVPTALHPRKVSPCATAANNWARSRDRDSLTMDLINNCPMKCSPINTFQKNRMLHFPPTTFILFNGDGQGSDNVTLNCSATSSSTSLSPSRTGPDYFVHSLKPATHGTQFFHVDCNCRLSYQSKTYYPKPCDSMLDPFPNKEGVLAITDAAPIHWYNQVTRQKAFKNSNSLPEELFRNPDKELTKRSLTVGLFEIFQGETAAAATTSQSAMSPLGLTFLLMFCLALTVTVLAVGWRLHKLIIQLERLGCNVREQGTFNINPHRASNGSGGHQVSYRNMGSLIDNDSLSVNGEGH